MEKDELNNCVTTRNLNIICKLSSQVNFHVWKTLITVCLKSNNLWDTSLSLPKDNDLTLHCLTNNMELAVAERLTQTIKVFTAPAIWKALIQEYDDSFIELMKLERELQTAFDSNIITIKNLVRITAIAALPERFN
ncbi:hypothetical protein ROZALSC1DRAFT_26221, partial [Rozella allomycis CSF55]